MALPPDLSMYCKILLEELSFEITQGEDMGMHKYYEWSNGIMKFSLTYDRGCYQCYILPFTKPINHLDMIRLLRFLKTDTNFYREELIKANLFYTLAVDEYIKLFHENYTLIKEYLTNYNQESYDKYNNFPFSFDGL